MLTAGPYAHCREQDPMLTESLPFSRPNHYPMLTAESLPFSAHVLKRFIRPSSVHLLTAGSWSLVNTLGLPLLTCSRPGHGLSSTCSRLLHPLVHARVMDYVLLFTPGLSLLRH